MAPKISFFRNPFFDLTEQQPTLTTSKTVTVVECHALGLNTLVKFCFGIHFIFRGLEILEMTPEAVLL